MKMNNNAIKSDTLSLDPERQQKAKQYAGISRRLMLVNLAIGVAYLVAWLVFGWSAILKATLSQFSNNQLILVAMYSIVFGGIFGLINLPISYYEGFVLPHRFGLSNQTLNGWILDQVKMGFVGGIMGLLILEVIYAVLRAAPETWWLWAAAILLFFNVLLANLAPVLLFPIFYKFEPLGEEYAELEKRLISLAVEAGTKVRGVFKFDMSRRTKAANAALTGLGNTRRILLGDTLLNEFSAEEIESVLAHELAHHVHKDIPIGILVQSIITLVGLYLAGLGLNYGTEAMGFTGPSDIAGLPMFLMVLGAFGLVTMPLTNAYSRWRERMADEYALQVTGNSSAFATAMTRLANQNLADADPEAWVEYLLYSHPALSKRIAMAESYNQ